MFLLRSFSLCAIALLFASSLIALTFAATPAQAAQIGSQVSLNPGGGVLADGSDGVRFTINAASDVGSQPGVDDVRYRGTTQYCCSAGAPMLNVGGSLFGQGGPAVYLGNTDWTSLTVLASAGSTVVGTGNATTGNASATVRYVATKNSLEYVMDRQVSYTYPNSFVTETYTFTIPEGNTEQVKFYQGGDTAPGGSDIGLGVMLTTPVRTVISLNPNSGIQFGFREMPGSKPFDGATARSFHDPYYAVQNGGDIGFHAEPALHDAGLMVQWNLGTAAGTQTASMQQYSSQQGANLTAGFDREFAVAGQSVLLNASIENTRTSEATGLGFTMTLPAGTKVAGGTQSNTCGGSLTAVNLGTSVVVTGASVGALTNCVVTVPVVADAHGTYTMSASNVITSGPLTNDVGTSAFFVPLAPEITTSDLGTLTVGLPAATAISALGAPTPTFAVTAGTLPAGLTLNAETGGIVGSPTAAGPYSVTVTASNAGGTDSHEFSGTVGRGLPGLSGTATPATVVYGSTVALQAASLPASAIGTVAFSSGATALCSVTLPATSCATPAGLLPGTYPVQANYSGDVNWLPRSVTVSSFTTTAAPTTVTGTLVNHTVKYGDGALVTASVSPVAAGGTIAVTTAGQTLCTITLPATGCTVAGNLPPGAYTIALAYSGDAPRYLPAAGQAGTLQVNRATPTPTPGSQISVYGEEIELTLPGLPTAATGSVTFSLDGANLCSFELGDATSCTVAGGMSADEYAVDVAYSGDDKFEPVGKVFDLTIEKASTAIGAPDELTGTYGHAVRVLATGVPVGASGSVEVSFGDRTLCTVAVSAGPGCDLPANLPAGEYSLLISYSGDGNHLGSDATTVVTIERANSEISVEDPIRADRNVPARIDVAGVPSGSTGTVTIAHDELGVLCSFDVAEANSCETTGATPPGTWPLSAVYSGDGNHLGSQSDFTFEVARDETKIGSLQDQSGQYGTTISAAASGLPQDATGKVTVSHQVDGETAVLCTFSVPGASTCELPAHLVSGSYQLAFAYSGDDNYEPSTSHTALTIDKAVTEIRTAELVTTRVGVAATITATGLPKTATGTVTVQVATAAAETARAVGGSVPGTTLCTFEVTAANSCETSSDLEPGSYSLVISYSGDANHAADQAPSRLVVEEVPAVIQSGSKDGATTDTKESLANTGAFVTWMMIPIGMALVAAGLVFGSTARRRRRSI